MAFAAAAIAAGLVFGTAQAAEYVDLIHTYWRVHDEVLMPTARGRHYVDLFWRHNDELTRIVMANPDLTREGRAILVEFEPGLRDLVDGRGDEVVITQAMVNRVQAYLDRLEKAGSPDLKATIEAERARTPLDGLVGMTFEQARVELVGLPETATPVATGTLLPP